MNVWQCCVKCPSSVSAFLNPTLYVRERLTRVVLVTLLDELTIPSDGIYGTGKHLRRMVDGRRKSSDSSSGLRLTLAELRDVSG